MPNQLSDARARRAATKAGTSVADGRGAPAKAYPVREYIGSMAQELAQMARWDGDEGLAALLDAAAERADQDRPDVRSEASHALPATQRPA